MKTAALLFVTLLVTACGSTAQKPGAYYQNDGPGNRSAVEFTDVADAVPRDEPVAAASVRPYRVFDRQYVPMTERQSFRQSGVASWYGKQFQGKPTAIGEPYDMYAMTGAHPTLPLPSYVRVKNLENDRTVVVRINDRGPFSNGRIIDLSFAAAAKLGYVEKGTTLVSIEVVDPVVVAMERKIPRPLQQAPKLSERKVRTVARRAPQSVGQAAQASLPVPGFPQAKPQKVAGMTERALARDKTGQRVVALRPSSSTPSTNPSARARVDVVVGGDDSPAVLVETIPAGGLRPAVPEPDQDARVARRDPLKPFDWTKANQTPAQKADEKQIQQIAAAARRIELDNRGSLVEDPLIYLQLGAFESEKAARQNLYSNSGTINSLYLPIEIIAERGLHKIQAGPFASAQQAEAAIRRINQQSSLRPFFVFR